MTEPPVSPTARRLATPGWLDTRLVLGVLLVLVSVIVGARVLSSADRSQSVWATKRDLAAGTQLAADDLTRVRVRLFSGSRNYVTGTGPAPVGWVVRRSVGAGELLPFNALTQPGDDSAFRYVTVPVVRGHLPPDLRSGSQVDVYVSPSSSTSRTTASTLSEPRLVVRNTTVLLRRAAAGLAAQDEEPVVLRVRPVEVPLILAAMSQGRIDLVGVPRRQEQEPARASESG